METVDPKWLPVGYRSPAEKPEGNEDGTTNPVPDSLPESSHLATLSCVKENSLIEIQMILLKGLVFVQRRSLDWSYVKTLSNW